MTRAVVSPGSTFSKSCQILSLSRGEHLALPGQLVLLLLIPSLMLLPKRARMGGSCIPELMLFFWGHLQGPSSLLEKIQLEMGSPWCPGPALQRSHVAGDGDLVVVAKGFGSYWQRSLLASPSGGLCHGCRSSCGELGKVADVLLALGDGSYHRRNYHHHYHCGPCVHVKPSHQLLPRWSGWPGEGEDSPELWLRVATHGKCPRP